MRYEVAGCSEQALRERNEDSHAVVDLAAGARLVLVADGLGGLRGGRTASRTAVSVLARRAAGWDPGAPDPELLQNLQEAFAEAHDALLRQGEKDPGLESCGTTLVAALLLPDRVLHSYTGDSRLYWFRAGRKLYQTRDHNLAQV
ncbi:MAG TPA: protein phosphatase 2C domain-containing protein, partial [Candidatus Nitrosotenuis sp.]|nr:protein phosphatase 2C domain-containing protein [Candidatus Nitrosotenuis sp.]